MNKHLRTSRVLVPALFLLLVLPVLLYAQSEIVLKNSFIQKYKSRVTIETEFKIDHVKKTINKPEDDGDFHIAGRSTEIGLPMVAEIMNAMNHKDAVARVRNAGESSIKIKGVWRLWCEHPGKKKHEQGKKVEKSENSNPDHVFQIHPITGVEDINLLSSLIPIKDYEPYDADKAFEHYENRDCEIISNSSRKTTTIKTKRSYYNYAEFRFELREDKQENVVDGRFVYGSVLNKKGDVVAKDIRLAFVKDSEPEKIVKSKGEGDIIRLLGIPRINLEEIWQRVKNSKKNPSLLKQNLPFEMIIVGVYK